MGHEDKVQQSLGNGSICVHGQYGAGCTRLGVQDASRKRTMPTHTPGPWAGTVTHTDAGEVIGMVSQEKWDRTKALIQELSDLLSNPPLPLHRLLQTRGFLIYVVRTYKWLNPYIKGLHLHLLPKNRTTDLLYNDRENSFPNLLERPHPQSAGTTKSQRRVGTRKRPKKKS